MTLSFFRHRLFLFTLLGLIVSAVGYQCVQARLAQSDIRAFVETKAGEILKADVKIDRVSYIPPFQIALQEIQMARPEGPLAFSVASIKNLIFGYGLLNLVRRDWSLPSTFILDSPNIHFLSKRSPLPFLESAFSPSHVMPTQFVIRGGEFRYPWGGGKAGELILTKVSLKAKPDSRGRIQVDLTASLGGVAQGKMRMRGFTDPQLRHYELEVHLENVTFLPESRVPFQKLHGDFRISEKLIEGRGLTGFFHDWEVKGEGKVENWQTRPKVSLDVIRKKGEPPFQFSLQMDFESEELSGQWSWAGRAYPFEGKVRLEEKRILFPHLQMPHAYTGKGEINPSNGDYDFWFERDRRRIHLHSNLSRLEFETEFQLDHVAINRLDWVVLGRARVFPLPAREGEEGPRFQGQIQTDYLIVEFEPLEDFQGSFELSPTGIQSLDFRWGGVFNLGGRILFRGREIKEDLVLRVDGFPLGSVDDFAGRPVPSNLGGLLEGKLKFRGEVERPEIQGYFTIKNGNIEKLDFDRAIVQFQGYPPYLSLYDSKIFKGRNTLKLTGAIDLALENFFHGIQIQGPDHLVIWKGLSVYWKEGESAIQGEKSMGEKMAMGFEVRSGVSDSKGEDRDENHAVLGPKLKF